MVCTDESWLGTTLTALLCIIIIFHGSGERNRGYYPLMTANKSEVVSYIAPTFSPLCHMVELVHVLCIHDPTLCIELL